MKHKWIKFAIGVIILLLAVTGTVAAAGFSGYKKIEEKVNLVQPVHKEEIKVMTNENIPEETVSKLKEKWTVALFGIDSRDMEDIDSSNSDVIILASVNNSTGEIKLASVYRDTCLKTGKNRYKKVNEAYGIGGPKKAVEVLNENLDLQIDDYVAVNWAAVATAINMLGGVDIDITEKEFKYVNAYITETVNSTGIPSVHLEAPGPNHLDGVQAVAYSRLRYTDNDFKRTERQRLVISLMLEKAKKSDMNTLNGIMNTVFPMIASSVDMSDVISLAKGILKYHLSETTGFPFEHTEKRVEGMDYVFPKDLTKNVSELHKFLYGTEGYEPSEAVRKISETVKNKSYQTDEPKHKKEETYEETVPETETETEPESVEETMEETIEETIEETRPEEYGPGFVTHQTEPETEAKDDINYGPGYASESAAAETEAEAENTVETSPIIEAGHAL